MKTSFLLYKFNIIVAALESLTKRYFASSPFIDLLTITRSGTFKSMTQARTSMLERVRSKCIRKEARKIRIYSKQPIECKGSG